MNDPPYLSDNSFENHVPVNLADSILNDSLMEEAFSIIGKSCVEFSCSPYSKVRRDVFLIRHFIPVRSNTVALLLLMLIRTKCAVLCHSDILKSIAPNASSDLAGKKLIKVYINDIRKKLRIAGFINPIRSHYLYGYSIDSKTSAFILRFLDSDIKDILYFLDLIPRYNRV